MSEAKDQDVLNAGLIAAAQAVEHYEMARYGTLRAWAEQLGMPEAVELLQATLEEETLTDEKLNQLALAGGVNAAAEKEESAEDEEEEGAKRAPARSKSSKSASAGAKASGSSAGSRSSASSGGSKAKSGGSSSRSSGGKTSNSAARAK